MRISCSSITNERILIIIKVEVNFGKGKSIKIKAKEVNFTLMEAKILKFLMRSKTIYINHQLLKKFI